MNFDERVHFFSFSDTLIFQYSLQQQITKAIDFVKADMRGNVDAHISVTDFKEFAKKHSKIPADDDIPFILAFEFNESEGVPVFEHILVFSTKRLLRNILNAPVIQADGTYKLLWQGSPLLVVGVNDFEHHFNLVAMTLSSKENKRAYSLTFSSIVEITKNLYGADITDTRCMVLILPVAKLIGDAAPQLQARIC